MVTSGEAGIDGLAPDECQASARGRADRVGRASSGVDTRGVPRLPRRRRRVRAASVRRSPSGPLYQPEIVDHRQLPAGDRHHRQLLNQADHFGGRRSRSGDHIAVGRALSTAVRDAGNRWVLQRASSSTASSRGAASSRSGRPSSPDGKHGVDTTDDLRQRAWRRWRPQGVHRRARLGELRPGEFLEGFGRQTRPAARGTRCRRRVRGATRCVGVTTRRP